MATFDEFLSGGAAGGGATEFSNSFDNYLSGQVPAITAPKQPVQNPQVTQPVQPFTPKLLDNTIGRGLTAVGTGIQEAADYFVTPIVKWGARIPEQIISAPSIISQNKEAIRMQEMMGELDKQLADKINSLPKTPEGNEMKRRLMQFYAKRGYAVPQIFAPKTFSEATPEQVAGETLNVMATALSFGTQFFGAGKSFAALMPGGGGGAKDVAKLAAAAFSEGVVQSTAGDLAQPLEKRPTLKEGAENAMLTGTLSTLLAFGGPVMAKVFGGAGKKVVSKLGKETVEVIADTAVDAVPGFRKTILATPRELGVPRPTTKIQGFVPGGQETEAGIRDIATIRGGDYVGLPNGSKGFVVDIPAPLTKETFDVADAGSKLVSLNQGIQRTEAAIAALPDKRYLSLQEVPNEVGQAKPALGQLFSRKQIASELNQTLQHLKIERDRLANIVTKYFSLTDVFDSQQRGRVLDELVAEFRRTPPDVTFAMRDPNSGELISVTYPFGEIKGGRVLKREILEPMNLERMRKFAPDVAKDLERTGAAISSAQINRGKDVLKYVDDAGQTHEFAIPNAPKSLVLGAEARRLLDENQVLLDPEAIAKMGGLKPVGLLDMLDDPRAVFRRRFGIDLTRFVEQNRTSRRLAADVKDEIKDLADATLKEQGILGKGLFGRDKVLDKAKLKEFSKRMHKALNTDAVAKGEIRLTPSERKLAVRSREITQQYKTDLNRYMALMGKKPFLGRENYITNLLTEQASAFLEFGGGIPLKILDLMKGKESFLSITGQPLKELIDVLLRERTGGLPIAEDFFKSFDAMVDIHGHFLNVAPEYHKLTRLMEHFTEIYGKQEGFATSTKYFRDYLKYMSGAESAETYLKNMNRRLMSLAIARDWHMPGLFSLRNPLSPLLRKTQTYHIAGRKVSIDIPKQALTDFFEENILGRTMVAFSPKNFLKTITSAEYINYLAFNTSFFFTNLTQFANNTPAVLRGSAFERFNSMVYGAGKALQEVAHYKTNLEKWQKAGLIEEFNHSLEMVFNIKNGKYQYKQEPWKDGLNFIAQFSEFLNRVGTVYAVDHNIHTSLRNGTNYYKELADKLPKEQLEWIKNHTIRAANTAHFRFGPEVKAALLRNPFWGAALMFNSYATNQKEYILKLARTLRESKEFNTIIKPALQDFKSGNMQGFINKAAKLKGFSKTEASGLVHFAFATTATMVGLGMFGGSYAKEFFLGWAPTYYNGLVHLKDAFAEGDEAGMKDAFAEILIPKPLLHFGAFSADAARFITGAERKPLKYWKLAAYSPLRKGNEAYQAVEAALTGKPQIVYDDKGRIKQIIDPTHYSEVSGLNKLFGQKKAFISDAWAQFLFGSRSVDDKRIMSDMNDIGKLKQKQSGENRGIFMRAREVLNHLIDSTPQEKVQTFEDLKATGQWTPEMGEAVMDTAYAQLYGIDALGRAIGGLKPELQAQFLMESEYIKSLNQEEVKELLLKWLANDKIQLKTLDIINSDPRYKKLNRAEDDEKSLNKWMAGLALVAGVTGGAIQVAIGPDRPGVELIKGSIRKFAQRGKGPLLNALENTAGIGTRVASDIPMDAKVAGKMFEVNFFAGNSPPLKQEAKIRAWGVLSDSINAGDYEAAEYAALDAGLKGFDRKRMGVAIQEARKSDVTPSQFYMGMLGYDGLQFNFHDTNSKTIFKFGPQGKAHRESFFTDFNKSKAEDLTRTGNIITNVKNLDESFAQGKTPINRVLAQATMETINKHYYNQYSFGRTFKNMNQEFTKMGNLSFGGHSSYATNVNQAATDADLIRMMNTRFSEVVDGMDGQQKLNFVQEIKLRMRQLYERGMDEKSFISNTGETKNFPGPGAVGKGAPTQGGFESLPMDLQMEISKSAKFAELKANATFKLDKNFFDIVDQVLIDARVSISPEDQSWWSKVIKQMAYDYFDGSETTYAGIVRFFNNVFEIMKGQYGPNMGERVSKEVVRGILKQ